LSESGFGIGEVGRRAGVRPSAIRYYEGVGLLAEPRRVGGQRRYDEGVFRCLANIEGARRAGFTISEMRSFFYGFPDAEDAEERWQVLARRKLREVDESISRLRDAKALLEASLKRGCGSVEECASLLAKIGDEDELCSPDGC
jgi:MerR family redox-sensitive transcriptional activator SoxR